MTGLAKTYPSSTVPTDIVRALRRLIRRSRTVLLIRGCFAVAAVALASLLGAMALDAGLTFFSNWPRWALSFSALGLTLLAAIWFLFRPLRRSFTLAGVARAIEEKHPELQERVSSAVELLGSADGPELRGSNDLIAALAGEACRDARTFRPRREVSLRAVRPYLLAAMMLGAVLAGAFLLWPDQAGHVWRRIVAPYRDLPNVLGSQLTIRPGDATIAVGEELEIAVEVSSRAVSSAEVYTPGPDGREVASKMTPLPARESGQARFTFSFPPAVESFRYRIRAGDALSRTYAVTVVAPPAVERFHISYEYPAYTGRPREDRPEGDLDIRAVAGTLVEVRAVTRTPVDEANLRVNGQSIAQGLVEPAGGKSVCTFRFEMGKKVRGSWSLELARTVGDRRFTASTEVRPIEAGPDAPPLVKVLSPDAPSLRLKPTDRLPILFVAGDDFGLSGAELLVDVDSRSLPPVPVPLTKVASGPRSKDANGPLCVAEGRTTLDLSEIAPGAGQVSFRIRVLDNLPASLDGPQQGLSPLCTIHLDTSAVSYVRQMVLAEELAIRDVLLAVLEELKESKKDSAPLKKELDVQAEPNRPAAQAALAPASAQRADRIGKHLATADSAIRPVLPRLADGEFADMGRKLTELADDHIARAHYLAGQIRLTDRPAERGELADETDFKIGRSIALVNDMLKELQILSQLAQRAEEAAELAQRQEELAQQAQDMKLPKADPTQADATSKPASAPASMPASAPGMKPSPSQANLPTPQQWQQEQQAVAARLAEMTRQSTKAMQQALARDQERTKNLSAEARKLAAEQTALAEMTKRAGEVAQLDKELRDLAAQQAALAEQAAKPAPKQATTMSAAAESLKTGEVSRALAEQQAAQMGLAQDSNAARQRLATADLARKAEKIAARQESIAEQSAELKNAAEAASAQAKTATTQAAQAAGEEQAVVSKLAAELTKLRDRQTALAARSAKIEDKPAATSRPASAPAPTTMPSESMATVAKMLTPDKLPMATRPMKEAIKLADEQAARLAAETKSADANAVEVEAQSAAAAAAQARAAVKPADDAARDARQAAQAADRKATDAEKKAADAQTAASKSVATSQPDASTKTAAEAARKEADTARSVAKAAGEAADRLDKSAKDAAERAAGAEKKAGELQSAKADRLAKSAGAKAKADEAAAVAAEQKKIETDLAQLAPAAKDARDASAKTQQARARQTQHEQAAAQAAEKLSQLAKPQQDLRDQAEELAKSSAAATPAAKDAVAKHDPKPAMKEAAGAMQSKAVPQAAKRADDAAKEARQLARDLRDADAQSSPLAKAAADQVKAGEKLQQAVDAGGKPEGFREAAEAADKAAAIDANASALHAAARQAALNAAQAARTAQKAAQDAQAAKDAADRAAQAAAKTPADPNAQQTAKQASKQAAQQAQTAAQEAAAARRKALSAQDSAQAQVERAAVAEGRQQEAAAGKLAELAKAQDELRKKVAEKAAQAAKAADALRQEQWAALKGQQEKVASETAALTDRVQRAAPQEDRLDTKAARSTAASAEKFAAAQDANGRSQAARSSEQSAETLGELAKRVKDAAAESEDANRQALARDTGNLAARQEAIAQQAKALAEGKLLDAVRPAQERVAGKTGDLADDVGLLRTFADQIIPDKAARQDANHAAHSIEQAVASQNQAKAALSAKSAPAAEAQQRKAAAQLGAAAEALDQLGKKMNDLARANPAQSPDEESGETVDAMEAADQAAKSQEARDAAMAAKLLQQLAKTTAQAAAAMGLAVPSEQSPDQDPSGQPSPNSRSLRGTGLVPVEMLTGELRATALGATEWGKLSGELKNEILQSTADEGPEEYRALIKRYFEEVARRGAEKKKDVRK